MVLTDQEIAQFQILYKSRFNREISRAEALEKGMKLVNLIRLIYRPMTETDYQKLQDRRRASDNHLVEGKNNEIARKTV